MRLVQVYAGVMTARISVTLDEEHAQRLKRMAEQAYIPEGTLARALLCKEIQRGNVIPLDEL